MVFATLLLLLLHIILNNWTETPNLKISFGWQKQNKTKKQTNKQTNKTKTKTKKQNKTKQNKTKQKTNRGFIVQYTVCLSNFVIYAASAHFTVPQEYQTNYTINHTMKGVVPWCHIYTRINKTLLNEDIHVPTTNFINTISLYSMPSFNIFDSFNQQHIGKD